MVIHTGAIADREILEVARLAAVQVRLLLQSMTERQRRSVESASSDHPLESDFISHDIKLTADRAAEKVLTDFLLAHHPLPILSEEAGWIGETGNLNSGDLWIVDPLDGSFNFSRGLPIAAVSIALWRNGKPHLGVVADVFSGEVFSGGNGLGVQVDGRPRCVSNVRLAGDAILCSGLPARGKFDSKSLEQVVLHMQRFKKVRYLGSAALSLAYVASGRVDAYREDGIRIWDVAAGLALIEAGGGHVNYRSIDPSTLNVSASNGFVDLPPTESI